MKILQILPRFYVHDMNCAIPFYEKLFQETCKMHFYYKEVGLELAQIGGVLLLAGSDSSLKPFHDTKATYLVDSVDEWKNYLIENGAILVRDKKMVPTGYNMTMKHPEGTIVEYVQRI